MIEFQEDDRERAIRDVLTMLRNPLAMMSIPDRHCAAELAIFHKITAFELLELAFAHARNRY